MPRLAWIAFLLLIVTALDVGPVYAQTYQKEEPAVLGAPGFVHTSALFGDDDPQRARGNGLTLGLLVRGPRSGRSAWVFEATLQPDPVQNPHFAEGFAPLYFQAGRQIGRRVYVRPSAGVVLQSGALAAVVGVAVGWEHQFRNGLIGAPEFIIRGAGAIGIAGWMAGVQVPIGRHWHP